DSAAPIRDPQGAVVGVVLIFRDITERKKADRALRATEARKAAIVETTLDAIITIDHEGKVVEYNPAAEKMFGYPRRDFLGRELAELCIPLALRPRYREGLARYLSTGDGPILDKQIEMPALRADGSEFLVELVISRIPTDGPPLFTGYLHDVSKRKQFERRRRARLEVNEILAQAASVAEAAPRLLQAVCENLEWDMGALWSVDAKAGV